MAQLEMDADEIRLEKQIHQALLEKGKRSWLYVIARNGYVHLFGFVGGLKEKGEIGGIVESIPGVRIVTNHLRLELCEPNGADLHF